MSIRAKIALIVSFFLWVLILAFTVVSAGVGINHPPTAQFSYLPVNLMIGTAVVFSATGSSDPDIGGYIISYAWDFDGNGVTDVTGIIKVSPLYTYTYTAAGTYTVTLTVTDNDGATGTCAQDITVVIPLPENQPPTAQFIAEPNTGELPLTVEFDAENSSDTDGLIESYAWDFGDAVTASGVSAIHTYNTAGTYTVTLTVTDDDGEIGTYTDIIECSPDQPPFIKSATWGPIKIFKGNVGDLYIKDNTGVGSVSYDLGKSTESTYIYMPWMFLMESSLETQKFQAGVSVLISVKDMLLYGLEMATLIFMI